MDESRLRSVRGDVEAHVEVPDFAVVAERGRQVRRRRAVVASAAVSVAVAVVAVGAAHTFDRDQTQGPVQQPAPTIDRTAAARVLSDPDAQVDPDASKVDGAGDMLAVVTVPGGRASPAERRTATALPVVRRPTEAAGPGARRGARS